MGNRKEFFYRTVMMRRMLSEYDVEYMWLPYSRRKMYSPIGITSSNYTPNNFN